MLFGLFIKNINLMITLEEKQKRIKNALQFSPVCVSVFAWAFDGEKYVKIGRDNHCTCLVGYKSLEFWLIYDSYPETNEEIVQQNMKEFNLPREKVLHLKKLDWSYDFGIAKRYAITKHGSTVKKSWWDIIRLRYLSTLGGIFTK